MSNPEKNPLAEMPSYEVLAQIIPRAASKTVAFHTHRSDDLVRKWQRDPDTEGGATNPLDDVKHLMEAILIVNPLATAHVPDWVNNTYRELIRAHHTSGFDSSEHRREAAFDFMQRAMEAAKNLNCIGATDDTLQMFIDLSGTLDQKIEMVRGEMAKRREMDGVHTGPRAIEARG